MAIELLTERHGDQIAGVLGCWDRMLIFGTLPKICFAGGMTSFLFERNIRIFDYPRFAEPFRNRIRENAEKLAADTGIGIEFIRKRNFRKEDRVKQALAKRGLRSSEYRSAGQGEPTPRGGPAGRRTGARRDPDERGRHSGIGRQRRPDLSAVSDASGEGNRAADYPTIRPAFGRSGGRFRTSRCLVRGAHPEAISREPTRSLTPGPREPFGGHNWRSRSRQDNPDSFAANDRAAEAGSLCPGCAHGPCR